MGTTTKIDIVTAVQEQTEFRKPGAIAFVEMLFDVIKEQLEQGDSVKLSGFGVFTILQKKSRPGRNPKTGEEAKISARKVVTFKASHILANRVRENS